MILTLVDILCHCSPYFNKRNYLDKVPAETISNFNSATQTNHEKMRPKLADMWKEWAARNSESLKLMVPAAPVGAGFVDVDDELADVLGN